MKHNIKTISFLLAFFIGISIYSPKAQAFSCPNSGSSQSFKNNHCGIWICAPGGFPATCSAQKRTFIKRIRKRGCPALPPYGSCSSTGNGSYRIGYDPFVPCNPGFAMRRHNDQDRGGAHSGSATCVNTDRSCQRSRGRDNDVDRSACGDYSAQRRAKPNYIDINVNGVAYDRQWY